MRGDIDNMGDPTLIDYIINWKFCYCCYCHNIDPTSVISTVVALIFQLRQYSLHP